MKTTIISVIILLFATVTFAGRIRNTYPVVSKTITLESPYRNIEVGENLKVVLLNDLNANASIEGDSRFVEGVNFEVKNGTLVISSKRNVKQLHGTIYLSVGNLKTITLSPFASVTSQGFLNCTELKVYINSESHAALKIKGSLNILPAKDCELEYERYQSITE